MHHDLNADDVLHLVSNIEGEVLFNELGLGLKRAFRTCILTIESTAFERSILKCAKAEEDATTEAAFLVILAATGGGGGDKLKDCKGRAAAPVASRMLVFAMEKTQRFEKNQDLGLRKTQI
ncbi:hypothetical protein SLEP1_g50194 [Rubroshorea leprosula]|uniref:Uncharacterized protein n=1 Tax=Rubroshorea leprosula TaxID=152421 RepID=A0AAV5LZ69_9ROSI|nr:hypothetical protein SLEP1_g50194 [Rubroshorea leprosula]